VDTNLEPKLAPPGAGLPRVELRVARLLFAWRRAVGNRAAFTARFQQERETVQKLTRGLDEASGARRVLISRPRGLEDSSRYWSIWMTLEHLRIVHRSVNRVIGLLLKGVTPGGAASTAAVKPSLEVTGSVVAEYERSCDDLLETVGAAGELRTPARYAHPWFGPLDAAGWHALSAGHLGIHRTQIERILEGLARARS